MVSAIQAIHYWTGKLFCRLVGLHQMIKCHLLYLFQTCTTPENQYKNGTSLKYLFWHLAVRIPQEIINISDFSTISQDEVRKSVNQGMISQLTRKSKDQYEWTNAIEEFTLFIQYFRLENTPQALLSMFMIFCFLQFIHSTISYCMSTICQLLFQGLWINW